MFRRVVFEVGGAKYVHERGVDFRLVDDSGQLVVCVGGGRMMRSSLSQALPIVPMV